MQTTALILAVLATATVAEHHGNDDSFSVKDQCRAIAKMTKLVDLAANQTMLDDKANGNQTIIDDIKAKAANATSELSTLTSNSTLVGECAVVQAHDDAVDSCGEIQKMEKFLALASNDTALTDYFDGNTTEIDDFKNKTSGLTTKLAALQSNATLNTFCSVQNDIESCKEISKLQDVIAFAGNNTALQSAFKGNTTDIDDFKSKVTDAQSKLDSLTSNSTLETTCASLSQAGTTTQGSTTSDSKSGTSLASRLEFAGNAVSVALAMAIFSMFML
ncbi:hypothetical protein F5Y15DRAFT_201018 [Xylariaceae sp. FL0016]|nr:hypothetical protein F5Y15DRAFT_201018 [Xylariaceae sp. FL0016]